VISMLNSRSGGGGRGRRGLVAAAAAGLVVAPLAVVSLATPANAAPVDIQILGTNDFHGRLLPNTSSGANEAGAAQFAGAVAQLRADNPNTVFAAGGDLIGASTFESFIQHDKPTLDALNAAGLDVSAAGNHEFDAGYDDLVSRVMAPFDATTNPEGGAEWQYLAANVRKNSDNSYALPDVAASPGVSDGGTWMTTVGGVNVGFVGTVTEDLPSLVSPDGITDVHVTDIVDETNAAADALKTAGADVVIMLVHEGATTTDIASATDSSAFGQIVAGVDGDVSAIISGHTHLAYDHVIAGRPVVSAGQYGTNLNKLVFTVDPDTDSVTLKEHAIVAANSVTLTAQTAIDTKAEVQTLVSDAVADAETLGAQELGQLAGPFNRARLSSGSENRGGESTLGNLVAEVQRWATSTPEAGSAQIAFMNPGGLRADMVGNNSAGYPAVLTYKQAALVQPFANTLVNMQMTGAQLKTLLEQQWQRDGSGNVPSRPFLRLGASTGFKFTYDPARAEGDRITGMWLDGTAIAPATSYSVTANSFLAAGGDNFRAFTQATGKHDSGKIDLETMVDYMDTHSPVAADKTQHAIGVSFAPAAPSVYRPGERIRFDLSSWAFSTAPDVKDSVVSVKLGGTEIGTAAVDNTIGTAVFDEYGKALVDVLVPAGTAAGSYPLTVVGDQTGTSVSIPVQIDSPALRSDAVVTAVATPATIKAQTGTSVIDVTVATTGHTPTGTVAAVLDGQVIGGGELVDGKAKVTVGPFATAGTKALIIKYYGDLSTKPASGSTSVVVEPAPVVEKATPTLTATVSPAQVSVMDDRPTVSVSVAKAAGTATGAVIALVDGKVAGAAELSGGKAVIELQPIASVGTKTIQLKYFGDDSTKPGATSVSVDVVKAEPRLKVAAPKRVVKGELASVRVRVVATGYTPTGKVTVVVAGKKVTKTLKDGKATLRVRMTRLGKNKVRIRYSGDGLTEPASKAVTIRVTRR